MDLGGGRMVVLNLDVSLELTNLCRELKNLK